MNSLLPTEDKIMVIYENGNNDYGKQISDFKGYISEIEQDLAEVKDLDDEATMLSDIQNGFYNTNVVKFLNPTSDEVEFTGTSPTFVEVCIYALYNRQVIFQLDYYQQRLFLKPGNEYDVLDAYRVKTYFSRKINLPFPITSELQKKIMDGSNSFETV